MSEYRIYCKNVYSYETIRSFEISAIFLQNWNISSIDIINTFTAEGFSDTSPLMHLNKHIFQSQ